MAHYFDDIFQRTVGGVPHTNGMPRIRRSSTARSIGARSDFDASVNGHDDDAHSTTASVFPDGPERTKEKEEADTHMHQYVSDQLERYKSDQHSSHLANAEEFEA
jgi:hypothetical protein